MQESEANKDEIIAQQREEIRLLKEKIDHLIKVIHGAKSEKLDAAQLELLLDPEAAKKLEAVDGNEEPPAAEDPVSSPRKRAPRKPRLPQNIPTTETVLIPDEVKANPQSFRQVGEKRSEKLDVIPTRYIRRVTIRPTFVEKDQPIPRWLTAPAPPSLLEGSILTPTLLAHLLTSKFCDHLPFYRQEQIMARRHGINIPRNTLCYWADFAAQTLEPLYKIIAQDLRASDRINIDETPVDYLSPEAKSSKQGYFWVYHSKDAGVLYDWQTGRGNECLDEILTAGKKHFKGLVQCDGYSAYGTWSQKHQAISLAGCWAHARRKFHEALPHSQDAARILKLIQRLYRDDDKYRKWLNHSNHPPEAITHYRRRHGKKLIKQIHTNILALKAKHLPKSTMGKAINYALNQWHKLCRAAMRCEALDNNVCENAVRPLKLGAKNWLFIGNEDTGWRSAVIYTFIENIRRAGRDPYAYLEWVFEKIPHLTNQNDLRELLPQVWIKLQGAETQTAEKHAA